MGMFDYIRCEVPLPDGWQSLDLQTKDFDCEMITHVISKDGRMLLDRGHYEVVPLMERKLWKPEWGDTEGAETKHPLEASCGCITRIPKYEDANFHGVVRFYGMETKPSDKFHEYAATFTEGQLVEIIMPKD